MALTVMAGGGRGGERGVRGGQSMCCAGGRGQVAEEGGSVYLIGVDCGLDMGRLWPSVCSWCCLARVWWWGASALEEVGPSEVLEVLAAANVLHRPRARGRAEEVLLEVR